MTQQVQDLIDKIKNEGIGEAQRKSGEIESQARKEAEAIIQEAKKTAAGIVTQAKAEAQKFQDSAHIALKQAGRDALLNVRRDIEAMFKRLIAVELHKALTVEELAEIVGAAIKGYLSHNQHVAAVDVVLAEKDLKRLKEGFLVKLKDHVKQPVTLHSAESVDAGFTISFDAQKSSFDFTDAGLAEFLGHYLNPELSALLKQPVPSQ